MPIHLPPISRRRFLAGSLAAAAAAAVAPARARAPRPHDPHRLALLADTHIDADPARIARDINMAEHFRQTCAELLKLDPAPAHVLIAGDFAFGTGQSGDYATALALLEPLRTRGMPVHVALGNHDHRERFWNAIPAEQRGKPAMKDRQAALLELPRANVIILDSLDVTNQVRGALGPEQLTWLSTTLDAHPAKPALVIVHHNLEIDDAAGHAGGVADTAALLDVLSPRKQVKALFYGHTHRWSHEQRPDGLHLLNLPATAYVFEATQPSGWVDAHVEESGVTLELRSLDSSTATAKPVAEDIVAAFVSASNNRRPDSTSVLVDSGFGDDAFNEIWHEAGRAADLADRRERWVNASGCMLVFTDVGGISSGAAPAQALRVAFAVRGETIAQSLGPQRSRSLRSPTVAVLAPISAGGSCLRRRRRWRRSCRRLIAS